LVTVHLYRIEKVKCFVLYELQNLRFGKRVHLYRIEIGVL